MTARFHILKHNYIQKQLCFIKTEFTIPSRAFCASTPLTDRRVSVYSLVQKTFFDAQLRARMKGACASRAEKFGKEKANAGQGRGGWGGGEKGGGLLAVVLTLLDSRVPGRAKGSASASCVSLRTRALAQFATRLREHTRAHTFNLPLVPHCCKQCCSRSRAQPHSFIPPHTSNSPPSTTPSPAGSKLQSAIRVPSLGILSRLGGGHVGCNAGESRFTAKLCIV